VEPAGCAQRRDEVTTLRSKISRLEADNVELAKERLKAPLPDRGAYTEQILENNGTIAECRTRIDDAVKQGAELGCGLVA
jgi:hypothetical protein